MLISNTFLKQRLNIFLILISLLTALNTFLLSVRKSSLSLFPDSQNPDIFYYTFIFLFAAFAFIFWRSNQKISNLPKIAFFTILPTAITLLLSMIFLSPILNVIFYLFLALYVFSSVLYYLHKKNLHAPFKKSKNITLSFWLKKPKIYLFLVFLICSIFLYFGNYNLSKFSAVDEPLWTFDRIPSFWKNVSQMNWHKTNISDKPGITVAMISGAGLTQVDSKRYDPDTAGSKNLNIETMNFAFRFPLIIFSVLMLGLFYFLIERLLGAKIATISTILIGTSPILIGMSRIINPDALLWIFAPLSILSFLVYQKRRLSFYLYLSGFLLGLSLLTKYVANILHVYFLLLLILEYVFNNKRYKEITLYKYFLFSIKDFFAVAATSLLTFYLLYPATWMRYDRLFEGTVLSQAFASTWPLFAFALLVIILDIFILKNRLAKYVINFFVQKRSLFAIIIFTSFLALILFTIANVYFGMNFYDFENILSSPKTSYRENGFFGFFVSNFYPLVFAISPLALLAIAFLIVKTPFAYLKNSKIENLNIALFLIIFILSYYLGTAINNVASTTRYQIMLYPLILIISAIGIFEIFKIIEKKVFNQKNIFFLLVFMVIISSIFSLSSIKPFYLSYASAFLPMNNYLDVKDMGPGSYEVAEYLNSLPNAENLSIWTDKKGVCPFFKGSCYGDLSYDELEDVKLDYVAVSWGRKSRTTNMVRSQGRLSAHPVFNFAKYYDQKENVVFELLINDRPSQYIKVIKVNN